MLNLHPIREINIPEVLMHIKLNTKGTSVSKKRMNTLKGIEKKTGNMMKGGDEETSCVLWIVKGLSTLR